MLQPSTSDASKHGGAPPQLRSRNRLRPRRPRRRRRQAAQPPSRDRIPPGIPIGDHVDRTGMAADFHTLAVLAALRGQPSPAEDDATLRVRTPFGGLHVWYRVPDGRRWQCSAGSSQGRDLAWQVDIRAHGGYIAPAPAPATAPTPPSTRSVSPPHSPPGSPKNSNAPATSPHPAFPPPASTAPRPASRPSRWRRPRPY